MRNEFRAPPHAYCHDHLKKETNTLVINFSWHIVNHHDHYHLIISILFPVVIVLYLQHVGFDIHNIL